MLLLTMVAMDTKLTLIAVTFFNPSILCCTSGCWLDIVFNILFFLNSLLIFRKKNQNSFQVASIIENKNHFYLAEEISKSCKHTGTFFLVM